MHEPIPDASGIVGARPAVLCVTDACDLPESELFIGLHRAGIRLKVLANPDGKNYQRIKDAGVPVAPIALTGRFDRAGTRMIREILHGHDFSIVHTFNPRALACSLRACKRMPVKVLAYRGVIGNVGLRHPESWITFLHRRLDRIVCVSDAVERYFREIRILGRSIAPEKIVRIYKGHNLDWYTRPAASLSEFGFPNDAVVFCCTGRDRPGKGYTTLIAALDFVPDDSPLHLLLVGDLQKNSALQDQIRQSRLGARVRFAGFRTDAPQIAAACDGFVLPSESEGLPRVVIEAMAYQRPVVVTDAGGMPELVNDGVEGLVVPVGDSRALANAMVQIAGNPDLAGRMGKNGRARIAGVFNSESTVRETIHLYHELLS